MTTTNTGVRCILMRGGTSKGAFFVESDLPPDTKERDRLLLSVMGSPDQRQIDGIGGAHPLTSKVAVVSASDHPDADVDYLFLQVGVDTSRVSDQQNCGNLLAAVGPFALEREFVTASGVEAKVRIRMLNTDSFAIATFPVIDGLPVYSGDTSISGVPGTAAAINLDFEGIAGGSCGSLLPTGNRFDEVEGVRCTLIDNGMPVVVIAASSVGVTGYESCAELEADSDLKARLEKVRLAAGLMMNLGDVTDKTVPKMTMVAPPANGGDISTRTFIPKRCHQAIGVLGAVSVATAARLGEGPAFEAARSGTGDLVTIEHPSGTFDARVEVELASDGTASVGRSGIVRTARKLFDGAVFPKDPS